MTRPVDLEKLAKRCERSITKMTPKAALEHIANLIDDSDDAGFERGVKRGLYLLDELAKREVSDKDVVLIEYFRANAWSAMEALGGTKRSWAWESVERQHELPALSRAINHPGFAAHGIIRRCQILTNHANLLNRVGRFIDAIASWDAALAIFPKFAMACGNRGSGLRDYAGRIVDDRERALFALHSYDALVAATAKGMVWDLDDPRPAEQFRTKAVEIKSALKVDVARKMYDLDRGNLGRSQHERAYRRWCLERRLFLCPLNDLGPHPAAATDDLMLPPLTERFDERPNGYLPPPIMGLFNQMKQEYASARFMLYEGVSNTSVHFSDRGVALTDTLDYPSFSLAGERIRTAFRIAYSLLDKVAFLIDHYWKLEKRPDRISFKSVWFAEGKSSLHPSLKDRPNWPLRGLFWLSKELFVDELSQATAADARELHDIRNALEHTYVRTVEGWAKPIMDAGPTTAGLGITIGSDELEAKAVRVLQMARSALFYVSFAIGEEERKRTRENPGELLGSLSVFPLDDRRKRRDPT